ncbi:MAG TPA: hypothetical protein VFS05_13025 [Gemmatimonadaceae bacterium]|nr:hypothetical protein [Gemmatimonadaceae bacterium]
MMSTVTDVRQRLGGALGAYGPAMPVAARLRALVSWAVLAPSGHNTQPWLFRIAGDALELRADRSRALPVADPDGRELVMSCGAALYNVRAALRHSGALADVAILPDADDPDLLARIRIGAPYEPTMEDEEIFAAIPARATCRLPFDDRPLPRFLPGALRRAVEEEGATLVSVEPGPPREALAELIAEGSRLQGTDAAFRRELSEWVIANHSRRRDGVPGWAFGHSDLASLLGPVVMDVVPWGGAYARRDRASALAAPAVVIVCTADDTPRDWLAAGQAVQRLLLRACTEGVSASFLNQAVQLPGLRELLRDTLGLRGAPQLVLRLGRPLPARETRRTPRREVEEVVL